MPELITEDIIHLLFDAVANGEIDTIQLLIDEHEIDLNVCDENGYTAYMIAANTDQLTVLEFLHNQKVDVNASNRFYETAFMLAVNNGSAATIEAVREHGGKLDDLYLRSPRALLYAVHNAQPRVVQCLLDDQGNPNLIDGNQNSCLMIAASINDEKSAALLIHAGADIDYKNHRNETALIIAARRGHYPIVKLLIESGPNQLPNSIDGNHNSCLMIAVSINDAKSAAFIINAGADIDYKNHRNETALIIAAMHGHYQLVKLLVESGANPILRNKKGETACDLAKNYADTYVYLKAATTNQKRLERCNCHDIPEEFICPISFSVIDDPITLGSGWTYDRASIENWLIKQKKNTCPFTCIKLNVDAYNLTTDKFMAEKIEEFIRQKETPQERIQIALGLSAGMSFFTRMAINQIKSMDYICPYSSNIILDPIILPDGNIADRAGVKEKFKQNQNHPFYKAAKSNLTHRLMKNYLEKYTEENKLRINYPMFREL